MYESGWVMYRESVYEPRVVGSEREREREGTPTWSMCESVRAERREEGEGVRVISGCVSMSVLERPPLPVSQLSQWHERGRQWSFSLTHASSFLRITILISHTITYSNGCLGDKQVPGAHIRCGLGRSSSGLSHPFPSWSPSWQG